MGQTLASFGFIFGLCICLVPKLGQRLWLFWESGCFRHHESAIRIQPSVNFCVEHLFTVNSIEKIKIGTKEAGNGQFKKVAKSKTWLNMIGVILSLELQKIIPSYKKRAKFNLKLGQKMLDIFSARFNFTIFSFTSSVTRLGNLLDFGPLFKPFGNN